MPSSSIIGLVDTFTEGVNATAKAGDVVLITNEREAIAAFGPESAMTKSCQAIYTRSRAVIVASGVAKAVDAAAQTSSIIGGVQANGKRTGLQALLDGKSRFNAQPYYFNLDTAAFDELRRQTAFRWAGQERLRRSVAQQAVGLGEEKITLKGAIFPGHKGGIKQLNTLRSIGRNLQPLNLVTGYGEVLGNWCLVNIEEEQSHLLAGGIPRKQGFSLEFVSYGNDLQNV
ncbi:phage tail protein [Pseudomonas kielensis]|nr:phage tail protein [Pseudomonas kielensis]UZM14777.1 phage tail protein [Pseudomonas kielensis]